MEYRFVIADREWCRLFYVPEDRSSFPVPRLNCIGSGSRPTNTTKNKKRKLMRTATSRWPENENSLVTDDYGVCQNPSITNCHRIHHRTKKIIVTIDAGWMMMTTIDHQIDRSIDRFWCIVDQSNHRFYQHQHQHQHQWATDCTTTIQSTSFRFDTIPPCSSARLEYVATSGPLYALRDKIVSISRPPPKHTTRQGSKKRYSSFLCLPAGETETIRKEWWWPNTMTWF